MPGRAARAFRTPAPPGPLRGEYLACAASGTAASSATRDPSIGHVLRRSRRRQRCQQTSTDLVRTDRMSIAANDVQTGCNGIERCGRSAHNEKSSISCQDLLRSASPSWPGVGRFCSEENWSAALRCRRSSRSATRANAAGPDPHHEDQALSVTTLPASRHSVDVHDFPLRRPCFQAAARSRPEASG